MIGEVQPELWWHLARASGIISWFLLCASVIWGVVAATDLFARHRNKAWLVSVHRMLGGLTVCFAGLHIAALIGDSYISFGWREIAIPFASSWKPTAVAAGVVAMWSLIAVQLSSVARRRLPRRVWRLVHYCGYLAFFFGSLHGTLAGTDASRILYWVPSTLAVLLTSGGTLYRILSRRAMSPRLTPTVSHRRPSPRIWARYGRRNPSPSPLPR